MKIVSCIKQVYDLDIILENDWVVDKTLHSVDIHYTNRIMNSYDEASLELMLQLQDKSDSIHTKAITIGEKNAESILKKALAIGVQEVLRIDISAAQINNPFDNAALLYESIKDDKSISLVLCGKQSDITNYGQTGQILAEKLGWSCFSNVYKIDYANSLFHLSRLLKDGVEHISTKGPLVITTIPSPDMFLRMATLREMLRAKKTEVKVLSKEKASLIISKPRRHYTSEGLTIDKPVKNCVFIEQKQNQTIESQLNDILSNMDGIGDLQ